MRFNNGQIHPGKVLRETKRMVLDALSGRELNRGTYIDTLIGYESRDFLYTAAKSLPPNSTIVEIGCYAGGSTLFLRRGAKLSDSYVYSVDPFDSELERQIQESDGSKHMQRIARGEHPKPSLERVDASLEWQGVADYGTLIKGFSQEVARRWDYGPIDLLFVDGNHNQAKADYDAWEPHLKRDALLVFDDANQAYKTPHKRVVADVELLLRHERLQGKKLAVVQKVERIVAFRLT